jgi:hypothetical protein
MLYPEIFHLVQFDPLLQLFAWVLPCTSNSAFSLNIFLIILKFFTNLCILLHAYQVPHRDRKHSNNMTTTHLKKTMDLPRRRMEDQTK